MGKAGGDRGDWSLGTEEKKERRGGMGSMCTGGALSGYS